MRIFTNDGTRSMYWIKDVIMCQGSQYNSDEIKNTPNVLEIERTKSRNALSVNNSFTNGIKSGLSPNASVFVITVFIARCIKKPD
jgi:hypothetical protein